MDSFEKDLQKHIRFKRQIKYVKPPEVKFKPLENPVLPMKQPQTALITENKFIAFNRNNDDKGLKETYLFKDACYKYSKLMHCLSELMRARADVEFRGYYNDHSTRLLAISECLLQPLPLLAEARTLLGDYDTLNFPSSIIPIQELKVGLDLIVSLQLEVSSRNDYSFL